MMKKLFLILMTLPFFGFGQSKTEKVATQVGAAAVVTAGVIGLFKKNKNKENPDRSKTENNKSNSANTASDGTFPVNAKPEDIVASIYKCTYKNFDEYTKRCVWKPTSKEINKLKQDNQEDDNWLDDPKLMFAAEVADSTLTFKQNGIDNIVVATTISSYSSDDKNASPGWANMEGFIRFQTTGKRMKLLSNEVILTEIGTVGGAEILKIDEENIFYSVSSWEGGTASHDLQQQSIYSLNGDFLLSYITNFMSAGQLQESNEIKIDEVNKLIKIVEPRITTDKKGKVIKTTYKTTQTYQYGNGTITEIKQPVKTKTTTKKK